MRSICKVLGLYCLIVTAWLSWTTAWAGPKNVVTGIHVDRQSDMRIVRIQTQSEPTFTVFRLSDPMRVVVDISGGDVSAVESPKAIEDGLLSQVAARQFSSDGFLIGRITIGFESDVTYDVYADGRSVVVRSAKGPLASVEKVSAPPTAPVDRAAAERFESARDEAKVAAEQARQERKQATEAAQLAQKQQAEALRVAKEAEMATAQAQKAKEEAERLRQQAQSAVQEDRDKAEKLAKEAEEKLQRARAQEQKVIASRAEAERAATEAERIRKDAEEAAAQSEAQHKKRVAEVEELKARTVKEHKAAEIARQSAENAKKEAETAQRAAETAKSEAEKTRRETAAKLEQINKQEKDAQKEFARLAGVKQEIEASRRAVEEEKQALNSQKEALLKERQRLDEIKANVEKEKGSLARLAEQNAKNAAKIESVDAFVKKPQPEVQFASNQVIAPEPKAAKARLTGVEEKKKNGAVLLALLGNPTYEVERVEDPPRLVIDLHDTTRSAKRYNYDLNNAHIRRIRLGEHDGHLRAVLDLKGSAAEHDVKMESEGLVIAMRDVAVAPKLEELPKEDAKPKPAAPAAVLVKDVRFSGKGMLAKITLDVPKNVETAIDDRSNKAWVLEIKGASLDKGLERSLDTVAFGTVVKMVSSYQSSMEPPMVKIVANLNGSATQQLKRHGNSLVWEIEGKESVPAVATTTTTQTAGFATEATTLARATVAQSSPKKRISIDLKDADIVNVLRLLSDVSGENIIASEDIKGKVTLRLRNVPWDQALDTILKTKGYDKVRHQNILRIAPAEQIQREKEMELARKRAQEQVEETSIKMVTINYASAKEISDQLKPLLSGRGSVNVDERTNTLILEDVRSNIDRIVELTKRLDKQTPQVLIEARIVEASSNNVTELGVQWGGTGQATSRSGNPTGLLFPGDVAVSGGADDQQTINRGTGNPGRFAVNLPAAIGSGVGGAVGFIFGSAGGSQILNLRLSAMESNGTGRIISSPRITTLDNRTARINQGVDIPISVVSAAGTQTRFVQAALELEVTPHVTNDGSVLMKVKAAKNEPDFGQRGGAGDPTIQKKTAETEVLVHDGDTSVIGGIYTRNTSESYAEVPLFSKIPILGWLFKKKGTQDKRAELLIFITPRIVNRQESMVEASEMAVPKVN